MNIFKCLAVLHLVILSAPFVVSMNNKEKKEEKVDYLSTLPKPVINLIAQELRVLKDLGNFARANKKINTSVKPELSRILQKLSQEFFALCVDKNLESEDLTPMLRMAKLCTIFNKSETKKEDYELLNKNVLTFIQKAFTRQIKFCRQAAIDSLVRLLKNEYSEAIVYAKTCLVKWKNATRSDLVENKNKLAEILNELQVNDSKKTNKHKKNYASK